MATKSHLASEAKKFLEFLRCGTLSTHSARKETFPYGSVVPYDFDDQGNIIILISALAEHYKNLKANSHASLFVHDPFGVHDPQAFSRLTLLLNFEELPAEEFDARRESYISRFPSSEQNFMAHDFLFYRGVLESSRWIAGFGDMGWFSVDDYREAPRDPVAYFGWPMVEHMNIDHRAALTEFLKAFHSIDTDESKVEMVFLDSNGFQIQIRNGSGTQRKQIAFPSPLQTPDQVRGEIVGMLQEIRKES